jgi:hypothetical protein
MTLHHLNVNINISKDMEFGDSICILLSFTPVHGITNGIFEVGNCNKKFVIYCIHD